MKLTLEQQVRRQQLWVRLAQEARDELRRIIEADPEHYGDRRIGSDRRPEPARRAVKK